MEQNKPDLINHIGMDLWMAASAWKARYHQEMVTRGYVWFGEARANLLAHMSYNGIAQLELTKRAGMSKQAVQQHLDELAKDGVIQRLPDPDDRRKKIVAFTNEGLAAMQEANEVKRMVEEEIRKQLGNHTMKILKSALAGIREMDTHAV